MGESQDGERPHQRPPAGRSSRLTEGMLMPRGGLYRLTFCPCVLWPHPLSSPGSPSALADPPSAEPSSQSTSPNSPAQSLLEVGN